MKILIVPDIHFGSKSFGKDFADELNSRIQDQLFLLDFVYQTAIVNRIDRMILLGDIFDKEHPEPILISTFFRWLTKCTDNFFVDIIVGNHDYKRVGNKIISILDTIPAVRIKNCKIYNTITSNILNDLKITYIPFFDVKGLNVGDNKAATEFISSIIKKEINKKTKNHICVGHLAIEKSIYIGDEISNECNEIFIPTSIFENVDYTWMGHIHSTQIMSKKPFVAHLGSLDKKTFKDKDKWIAIYDSKTNLVKDIKLPCRNLVDISISVPENIENVNDFIKDEILKFNNIEDSIVRVKIEMQAIDTKPIAKKEIYKLLHSMKVQYVTEMIEKKKISSVQTKTKIDETTDPNKAVDMFLELVTANDDFKKQLSSTCKDIINLINL